MQFLEQQVCALNWDVGFVTYTMQEIGVPLPRLLEVYDQLFKARVRKITTQKKKEKKNGGGEGGKELFSTTIRIFGRKGK